MMTQVQSLLHSLDQVRSILLNCSWESNYQKRQMCIAFPAHLTAGVQGSAPSKSITIQPPHTPWLEVIILDSRADR